MMTTGYEILQQKVLACGEIKNFLKRAHPEISLDGIFFPDEQTISDQMEGRYGMSGTHRSNIRELDIPFTDDSAGNAEKMSAVLNKHGVHNKIPEDYSTDHRRIVVNVNEETIPAIKSLKMVDGIADGINVVRFDRLQQR